MTKHDTELYNIRIAKESLEYVKSHPCSICNIQNECRIRYKRTCGIWQNIADAFRTMNMSKLSPDSVSFEPEEVYDDNDNDYSNFGKCG